MIETPYMLITLLILILLATLLPSCIAKLFRTVTGMDQSQIEEEKTVFVPKSNKRKSDKDINA